MRPAGGPQVSRCIKWPILGQSPRVGETWVEDRTSNRRPVLYFHLKPFLIGPENALETSAGDMCFLAAAPRPQQTLRLDPVRPTGDPPVGPQLGHQSCPETSTRAVARKTCFEKSLFCVFCKSAQKSSKSTFQTRPRECHIQNQRKKLCRNHRKSAQTVNSKAHSWPSNDSTKTFAWQTKNCLR